VKLALALSSVVIVFGSGCATAVMSQSNEDAGAPAADAAKDSAPIKKVPDSGVTPPQDSGNADSNAPADDSTCAGQSTQSQCEQCCLSVHPGGYNIYHQELVTCACTSPGACATECQTELCANQPTTTGDACETCITASLTQGTGACYTGVSTACQADTDCTDLFSTCIPPCETK